MACTVASITQPLQRDQLVSVIHHDSGSTSFAFLAAPPLLRFRQPVVLTSAWFINPPTSGILRFDYVITSTPDHHQVSLPEKRFQVRTYIHISLEIASRFLRAAPVAPRGINYVGGAAESYVCMYLGQTTFLAKIMYLF